MTKLLLTVSLLLTSLACDGSGDLTSEADASPDSLTQVRADGGADLLPTVKIDTLSVVRPTACPTPIPPKKGYIFTEGKVTCSPSYLIAYPGLTCEQIMTQVGECCVSIYGKSNTDSSLYDLASWKMVDGRQVSEPSSESSGICSAMVARLYGETAVCSVEGRFMGWTCL
jgi:hypothetical protein